MKFYFLSHIKDCSAPRFCYLSGKSVLKTSHRSAHYIDYFLIFTESTCLKLLIHSDKLKFVILHFKNFIRADVRDFVSELLIYGRPAQGADLNWAEMNGTIFWGGRGSSDQSYCFVCITTPTCEVGLDTPRIPVWHIWLT